MSKGIDEILLSLMCGLDEPEVFMEDYSFIEAKQALYDFILSEVIGTKKVTLTDIYGNDSRNNYGYNETEVRDAANYLQDKQTQKLAQLFGRNE